MYELAQARRREPLHEPYETLRRRIHALAKQLRERGLYETADQVDALPFEDP